MLGSILSTEGKKKARYSGPCLQSWHTGGSGRRIEFEASLGSIVRPLFQRKVGKAVPNV
jgi:hypothetical protein